MRRSKRIGTRGWWPFGRRRTATIDTGDDAGGDTLRAIWSEHTRPDSMAAALRLARERGAL
ncbi:hypothetical protein GCM10022220_28270 [Actinocatenispora rupis]|uniref:Uncharacterized protein n=1 Tax=Actinocatenispora rupis TaxID=519421 RepID=A0A8J3NDH3_9ACTN|nr:hypothetical protein Aru02nite_23930 [Actinocatenispora rupis]